MATELKGLTGPLLAGCVVLVMAASACGAAEDGSGSDEAGSSAASQHDLSAGESAGRAGALPSQHVHGVARNPGDGLIYLATHDGLFRIRDDVPPARVGPVIDLMGFTVAGPNHFYASGHPGPGVDLPNPVGLIETADGGNTWTTLSRQGQSDFHTLSSSRGGIVGFDGEQTAMTSNGRTWQQLAPPAAPTAVAASPDGAVLLVTSHSGLLRSSDRGRTWAEVQTPLLLQLVSWADATTVTGVAPDGRVAVSTDAAATWTVHAGVGATPHAIGAHRGKDGSLEVLVVTAAGILRSTDDAKTFTPYGR